MKKLLTSLTILFFLEFMSFDIKTKVVAVKKNQGSFFLNVSSLTNLKWESILGGDVLDNSLDSPRGDLLRVILLLNEENPADTKLQRHIQNSLASVQQKLGLNSNPFFKVTTFLDSTKGSVKKNKLELQLTVNPLYVVKVRRSSKKPDLVKFTIKPKKLFHDLQHYCLA